MRFDDYVEKFKEIGEPSFRRAYSHPVLIGLGVVGELAEGGRRGQAQTFLSALYQEEASIRSLMRRVWLIRNEYEPQRRSVFVGRDASNDVAIPDYSISKRHCKFVFGAEECRVIDLHSHNGTIVASESLSGDESRAIEDEDEIVLGRYMFEFLTPSTFVRRVKTVASSASS